MKMRSDKEEKEEEITRGWPKKDPYVAPEGYFDELQGAISNKVSSGRHDSRFSRLLDANILPLKLAALVVILLGAVYLVVINKEKDQKVADSITFEAIENSDLLYELEEKMIVDTYSSSSVSGDQNLASNEPVVDYLIENNIEVSQILNEL